MSDRRRDLSHVKARRSASTNWCQRVASAEIVFQEVIAVDIGELRAHFPSHPTISLARSIIDGVVGAIGIVVHLIRSPTNAEAI